MAKIKAPLLSLGASGQLGKTMVMSSWKGIKTAREYVIPANPRTVGQVAQRTIMSEVVAHWQTKITAAAMRTAWNLAATVNPKPLSGFNDFTSNIIAALTHGGDAIAVKTYTLWHGDTPRRLTPGATATTIVEQAIAGVNEITFANGAFTLTGEALPFGSELDLDITSSVAGGFIRASVLVDGVQYWVSGILPNPNAA